MRHELTFRLTSGGGGFYTVDTPAVAWFPDKTQSNGDLISLKYNGVELQSQSRFSHVESGSRYRSSDGLWEGGPGRERGVRGGC